MKKVYIASPLTSNSAKIERERYEQVKSAVYDIMSKHSDVIPYSPILHFYPLACSHNLPKNYEYWKIINLEMLRLFDELWVIKIAARS